MAVVQAGLGTPIVQPGQVAPAYLHELSYYASAADVAEAIVARVPTSGVGPADVVIMTNKVGRHHPGQSSGRAVAFLPSIEVRDEVVAKCDNRVIVNRPAVSLKLPA